MKTGEQECREKPQVAELLVHHSTLNSKTLTHQLGGVWERRVQEVWEMGVGEANWTRGVGGGNSGNQTVWFSKSPGSPPPASNVVQMKV